MKIRFVIYLVILISGAGFYIFYTNPAPAWSPWYCDHFSGKHFDAWSPPTTECERVGCKIQKIRNFDGPPGTFDTSGFDFECVKK